MCVQTHQLLRRATGSYRVFGAHTSLFTVYYHVICVNYRTWTNAEIVDLWTVADGDMDTMAKTCPLVKEELDRGYEAHKMRSKIVILVKQQARGTLQPDRGMYTSATCCNVELTNKYNT